MARIAAFPSEPPTRACKVVIDTREQLGYDLADLFTVIDGTLQSGDYGLADEFSGLVAIERKTLDDFVSSCSTGRQRFDRELDRLRAFPTRAIVVEASFPEIDAGMWRARATPLMIRNSITSFYTRGVPVFLAGDRTGGKKFTAGLLWRVWLHEYRRVRAMAGDVQQAIADAEKTS